MTPAALTVEQYAEFVAPAARMWSIIAVPHRLPEWTGARRVEIVDPGAAPSADTDPAPAGAEAPAQTWAVGMRVSVAERDTTAWEVISVGRRLVEASAATPCGQVGIGVRVIELRPGDLAARPARIVGAASEPAGNRPSGSRVVFVARLEPAGSSLRARMRDLPALRRRFDRWAGALREATGG